MYVCTVTKMKNLDTWCLAFTSLNMKITNKKIQQQTLQE